MVLSYSRLIFLRFFYDARLPSFLKGHVEAFAFFGGVARTLLYDNLKSAVLERKGSAFIQDRTGPERAFVPGLGIRLAGMVHNFADVLKLLGKEELIPRHVHRGFYLFAPVAAMCVALVIGAVIPFGPNSLPSDFTRPQFPCFETETGARPS